MHACMHACMYMCACIYRRVTFYECMCVCIVFVCFFYFAAVPSACFHVFMQNRPDHSSDKLTRCITGCYTTPPQHGPKSGSGQGMMLAHCGVLGEGKHGILP